MKLERLQNVATRFILKNKLQLFNRRTLHVANRINRIISGEAPKYLEKIIFYNKNNVGNNKLIIGNRKIILRRDSFGIGGPLIWKGSFLRKNF